MSLMFCCVCCVCVCVWNMRHGNKQGSLGAVKCTGSTMDTKVSCQEDVKTWKQNQRIEESYGCL